MKVRDLIEALSALDPDLPVVVCTEPYQGHYSFADPDMVFAKIRNADVVDVQHKAGVGYEPAVLI